MPKLLRNSKKYSNFAADTNTHTPCPQSVIASSSRPPQQKEPYITYLKKEDD